MAARRAIRCAWPLVFASLLLSAAGAAPALDADPPNIGLLRGPGMAGSQMDLYLEVWLNGVGTQRVLHVAMTADGRYHVWPENLRDAGIRTDGLPQDRYLDLASIPGLDYAVDMPNQRLDFSAAGARIGRATQRLNLEPAASHPARVTPGALLNYDLYGNAGEGGTRSFSALTELRGFGGWGLLSSTGLSAIGSDREDEPYIRLDTTWSASFQDRLATLNLGDFAGGSLGWSRATRMGGVQLRRNFALQPGLITYPLPAFFGQATLPSSVELYVNGMRQYEGEVAPGPFQLFAVPGVNGAGQAQVVVTDALGRRNAISFPFYSSSQLLGAGLSDWSVEAGAVRRDYGLRSFRYGDAPAASGSLRHGWREWLTLEGHAEAGEGLVLGGLGAVLRLGGAGVVNAAYAASGGDAAGGLASLGYSWVQPRFNLGFGINEAFDDYRDIASVEGEAPPRRSAQAVAGLQFGPAGSVSLNYSRLDTDEEGRQHYAGVGYSLGLPRGASLFANATRNLDDADDLSLFAGLVWNFSSRTFLSASLQHSRGRDLYGADLASTPPVDGGAGWSLRARQGGGVQDWQAEGSYRGDHGQIVAGLGSVDTVEAAYASYSGGLLWMDRDVFAGRRIDDAFVLVSSSGVPDVPVYLENRPIGRTDAQGHYLLGSLNAWQPNRVSIDALALPAQLQAAAVEGQVVPRDRAGVLLDFGLREVRAAVVTLTDAQGQPLPLGSRVRLQGGAPAPQMLGYDGQVYLEGLSADNRISVVTPQGEVCETRFAWTAQAVGIPALGPFSCRLESP